MSQDVCYEELTPSGRSLDPPRPAEGSARRPADGNQAAARLIGRWQLVSCRQRVLQKMQFFPLGRNPRGVIHYLADGSVYVMIAREHNRLRRVCRRWTLSAQSRAVSHTLIISYSGRWKLQDQQVVHSIDLASNPQWMGQSQIRFWKMTGDRLTLRTPDYRIFGVSQSSELEWIREAQRPDRRAEHGIMPADVTETT